MESGSEIKLSKTASLHVRADSAELMDALFDVLKPDSPRYRPPRLQPWHPKPMLDELDPSHKGSPHHSTDSGLSDRYVSSPEPTGSSRAVHSRAFSSPASLQQTWAIGSQQQHHQHHLRQHSYDDLLSGGYSVSSSSSHHDIPLPEGWEQSKTQDGRIYFLNHVTQTTTWEDPRKGIQHHQQQQPMIPEPVTSTRRSYGPENNYSVSSVPSMNAAAHTHPYSASLLPEGWEQAVTPEGHVYFVDHRTQQTSWIDPRLNDLSNVPASPNQQCTAFPHDDAQQQSSIMMKPVSSIGPHDPFDLNEMCSGLQQAALDTMLMTTDQHNVLALEDMMVSDIHQSVPDELEELSTDLLNDLLRNDTRVTWL